jgi:crotonobetainyl-CoA:carnitine CoA-transferase CaiB-like acyl-CoA transferase
MQQGGPRPIRRLRHNLLLLGTQPAAADGSGPLAGIRVLDMSAVISGPWATSFLADQGAEVIKLEGPRGPDLTRMLGPGPPSGSAGMAGMYVSANRGKRSIVLDLGSAEGLAALMRLAASVDVVVQNYRPGVAERLGVDYASLVAGAARPDLIVLSISGYGQDGPYVRAPVYDQVVQAMSGVGTTMTNEAGQPTLFHNLVMDKVTALNASQSITAALLARERGRGGQHIELS